MATRSGSYGESSHRGGERARDSDPGSRSRNPGGYTRSDDRICEDLRECLANDSLLDASEIEVSVGNGEATLSGAVADAAQRNRAQELAENISGVRNVRNALRIRQHGAGTTGNATGNDGGA